MKKMILIILSICSFSIKSSDKKPGSLSCLVRHFTVDPSRETYEKPVDLVMTVIAGCDKKNPGKLKYYSYDRVKIDGGCRRENNQQGESSRVLFEALKEEYEEEYESKPVV